MTYSRIAYRTFLSFCVTSYISSLTNCKDGYILHATKRVTLVLTVATAPPATAYRIHRSETRNSPTCISHIITPDKLVMSAQSRWHIAGYFTEVILLQACFGLF